MDILAAPGEGLPALEPVSPEGAIKAWEHVAKTARIAIPPAKVLMVTLVGLRNEPRFH
jgi:hypothetical protein